jgi:hypothetical protein
VEPNWRTLSAEYRMALHLSRGCRPNAGWRVPILHLTATLGCLKRRRGYDDQKEIRIKIRVKTKSSRSNVDHVNGYESTVPSSLRVPR